MTEQQNGTATRRPESVSSLLRSATTMHQLEIDRDEEKRRADHYERLSTVLEVENGQLREALERMTAERDGYFQDATVLRSQFMSIGNAFTDAVNAMTERQAFTPTPSAGTAPIDNGAPLPRFIRPDAALDRAAQRPNHPVDLDELAVAIGGGR
jgi:hypothetical protein